jgi:hypothetical protein
MMAARMPEQIEQLRLARRRLQAVRLSGPALPGPIEVVRWLGAVQSQDYGPAKWSVAQRTTGVDDAGMDQLFNSGALLRTHVLRPTWHFVLPDDIRGLLALTGPRVHALAAYYYRQLELDDAVFRQTDELLRQALRDRHFLTRRELHAVFAEAGIVANNLRLGYILMHAELEGLICSGPLRGHQHTYGLLDERAAAPPARSTEEELSELTRRYFTSHGPASAKDFHWWSSLTLAQIKRGLELGAGGLERETIDGVTYWFGASLPPVPEPDPTVHLLQGYDEYVIGYFETKYVLDIAGKARARPVGPGQYNLVLLLDTQVAGGWKRTVQRDAVRIDAALNRHFGAAELALLQRSADRFAQFVGRPAAALQVATSA